MKQLFIIFLYSFFLLNCHTTSKNTSYNFDLDNKIDSIEIRRQYFNLLDSVIKANPLDTSIMSKEAIKYMEEKTGIKASSEGNYFGAILFTRKDIIAWKKWFAENDRIIKQ